MYGEGEEKEEVPESVSKVGPVTVSAGVIGLGRGFNIFKFQPQCPVGVVDVGRLSPWIGR